MSPGVQNIKMGHDALGTAENESESKNVKMGPDTVGTAEHGFGSQKLENGIRHRRYRQKRVRELKT
jgi:hypothetical protein